MAMYELTNAVWIELRKAVRSRVPLFTAVGFLLLPVAAAFLIFVVKDPQLARKVGLISSKADLLGRTADWPSYLNLLSQIIAVGGLIFFSLAVTWVFGREFADGTVKDLLAVPISRAVILLAKFIVVALWCSAATAMMIIAGLIFGAAIGLPQESGLLTPGLTTLVITACLVLVDVFPVAFFASVGRGYLLPMGVVILVLIFGNIAVIAGYGDYFPWSVPGLYTQTLESRSAQLEPISFVIVILTGLAGMAETYLWWKLADQNK
jgi:ABC-2 type transport system permease protein